MTKHKIEREKNLILNKKKIYILTGVFMGIKDNSGKFIKLKIIFNKKFKKVI